MRCPSQASRTSCFLSCDWRATATFTRPSKPLNTSRCSSRSPRKNGRNDFRVACSPSSIIAPIGRSRTFAGPVFLRARDEASSGLPSVAVAFLDNRPRDSTSHSWLSFLRSVPSWARVLGRPPRAPPTPTQPAETVLCVPETLDSSSPFSGDPCPGALTAVQIAVQSTGLTIARIVLQPYGFSCGELWPGVGSPLICYGPMVISGTAMHGWVSFAGSPRIAAIYLHRPNPEPGSSSPPDTTWTATIEALAIPPSGWSCRSDKAS